MLAIMHHCPAGQKLDVFAVRCLSIKVKACMWIPLCSNCHYIKTYFNFPKISLTVFHMLSFHRPQLSDSRFLHNRICKAENQGPNTEAS